MKSEEGSKASEKATKGEEGSKESEKAMKVMKTEEGSKEGEKATKATKRKSEEGSKESEKAMKVMKTEEGSKEGENAMKAPQEKRQAPCQEEPHFKDTKRPRLDEASAISKLAETSTQPKVVTPTCKNANLRNPRSSVPHDWSKDHDAPDDAITDDAPKLAPPAEPPSLKAIGAELERTDQETKTESEAHHLAVGNEVVKQLEKGPISVKDALWRDWIPTQPSARSALIKYKEYFDHYKHHGPWTPPETVHVFKVNIGNLPSAKVRAMKLGGHHIVRVPQLRKEDLVFVLEKRYEDIPHMDNPE